MASQKRDFSTKTVGELFWMLPLTEGKGSGKRQDAGQDHESTTYTPEGQPSSGRTGRIARLLLFIINIISCLAGIALLVVGSWMLGSQTYMEALFGSSLYSSSAWLLIFGGVAVVVVSFLGGFAAVVLNRSLLMVYGVIVLLVAIAVIIGGVVALLMNGVIESSVKSEMKLTMELYVDDDEIKQAWDDTQNKLHCCGVDGWNDWDGIIPGKQNPESCCIDNRVECATDGSSTWKYKNGCYDEIRNSVGDNIVILAILGFIMFALLVTCIISAFVLIKSIA